MKGFIVFFVLMIFLVLSAGQVQGQEYEKIAVKHGMYEEIVNEKFGQPVLTEEIKPGFWPIPKKKALYELGDGDYMILNFFSGRVSEITILSEMDQEEVVEIFEYQLGLIPED